VRRIYSRQFAKTQKKVFVHDSILKASFKWATKLQKEIFLAAGENGRKAMTMKFNLRVIAHCYRNTMKTDAHFAITFIKVTARISTE
jgi:hypothetical protein